MPKRGGCLMTKNAIVNYFYNLEFLNPVFPTQNIIFDSRKNTEPFQFAKLYKNTFSKKDPNKKTIYTIFVGNFNYEKAIEKLAEAVNIKSETKYQEEANSVIFAYRIKEDGSLWDKTFSVANCIYALNKMLENKNTDVDLLEKDAIEKYALLLKKVSTLNTNDENFLNKLKECFSTLDEVYPYLKDFFELEYIITKEEIYLSDEEMNSPTPAILPSFYLQDLDYIRNNTSEKIKSFLQPSEIEKIEIDKNVSSLEDILDPNNYPLGKWPSSFCPALMQQVAINLGLNTSQSIFSVNGPPGSGKTTLVKELIADQIVKRARLMTKFRSSDEAFNKIPVENSSNKYIRNYFKVDPSLKNFGIIVASNNNSAVENISLELPIAKSMNKTLSNLFNKNDNEDIFFTDTANNLFTFESWGLISAPMGKKENISKFINAVWFNKESSIKIKFDQNDIDFEKTKEKFNKKYSEVKSYREYLSTVKSDTKKLKSLFDLQDDVKNSINEKLFEIENLQDSLNEFEASKENLTQKQTNYKTMLQELKNNMVWYLKIFGFIFKRHPYVIKKNELNENIVSTTIEILELSSKINDIKEEYSKKTLELDSIETHFDNIKKDIEQLSKTIKKYKNIDKITLADEEFFKDISNNKSSQEASVWTNNHYDRLREELFYEALQMHKAFVLTSKSSYTNLRLLVMALRGEMDEDIKKICYGELINTLFFLTPVISTSLASVQKFLSDIKEDEIGNLIIDEAGQATPGSVLGAINRSIKTIILGDPFQIEPVVTTPSLMYKILNSHQKINAKFENVNLSAQIIADIQNKYGTIRGEENDTWIGSPLLLHRRCLNPMFAISNEIAYDNKMFYCTKDNSNEVALSIKESAWYDIKGKSIDNSHYVKEQGKLIIKLLKNALKVNNNDLPNIYIIAPFRDIVHELKKELKTFLKKETTFQDKDINNWINKSCGTIHTFQGKEANEVILVLGCDHSQKGAVNWASNVPNILNVAVTRAKYRLIIIGDISLWSKVKYFETAYRHLNTKTYEAEKDL